MKTYIHHRGVGWGGWVGAMDPTSFSDVWSVFTEPTADSDLFYDAILFRMAGGRREYRLVRGKHGAWPTSRILNETLAEYDNEADAINALKSLAMLHGATEIEALHEANR